MKKNLIKGLALMGLGFFTGCSSTPWNEPVSPVAVKPSPAKDFSYKYTSYPFPGMTEETYKEWSKPFVYEGTSGRVPSSEMLSRPTYFWEADTLKIPVTPGGSIDKVYKVKFNQYSSYNMKETVIVNEPRLEVVWEELEELVLYCEGRGGVGKSEYWNSFYSAPSSQKAQALARAIEGVGEASARALINQGYFNRKPTSWRDFEDEIERAARNNTIAKIVEYQVLYKYRQENMRKLGYNTQSTGDCRLVMVRHIYPREVLTHVPVKTEKIVPHRDLISSETKEFHIKISGQRLQPFEQEMLVFSFDHDSNQVSLAPAAYNNYTLSIAGDEITVTSASRRNVNLPGDVVRRGATLEASNGMASFSAPINNQYVPKSAADGYLMVSIQVYSCNKGVFGCAVMDRDERFEPVVVKVVEPGSGLINYKFPVQPGRKTWVKYWVNMANSPWYINNVVIAEDQPEI